MNEEQIEYVVGQLKAGVEKNTLKDSLKESGYTPEAIDALITEAQKRMEVFVVSTTTAGGTVSNLSTPHTGMNKSMVLIIAVVAVIVIGGGAFVAFSFFGSVGSTDNRMLEDGKETAESISKENSCEEQYKHLLSLYEQDYSDCTVAVSEFDECTATPQNYKVSVVFDSSGSMAGEVFGERKLDIAREETLEALNELGETEAETGIVVYGHEGSNNESDKALSCKGIEVLRPVSGGSFDGLRSALSALEPTGWTPIADALEFAADQFSDTDGHEEIILVSDGIETCGGDPVAVAKKLKGQGIEAVTVIGFDVSGDDESQLSAIAEAGSGRYFSAGSRIELEQAFDEHRQWAERFECQMDQFSENLDDFLDVTFKYNECTFRLEMDEAFPISLSVSLNSDGITDQCVPYIKEQYEKKFNNTFTEIKRHFEGLREKVYEEDPFGSVGTINFDAPVIDW